MTTMVGISAEIRTSMVMRGPQLSRSRNLSKYGNTNVAITNERSRHARTMSGSHCSTSGAVGLTLAMPASQPVFAGLSTSLPMISRNMASNMRPQVTKHQSVRRRRFRSAICSLSDEQAFARGESEADSLKSSPSSDQGAVQGFADVPSVAEFGAVGVGLQLAESEAMAVVNPALNAPRWIWFVESAEQENLFIHKAVNAVIVGTAGIFALTTMFTVDHDYWHGWTLKEILQYAPAHNWFAYEQLLKSNPIFAKMIISGTVYAIGDWIAQCVEGKGALEFSRLRMLRSGTVGFCLHGSMSHFYYHFCEWLFPFEGWWVLPLKVGFDQTIWSGLWNSIYFSTLGLLRFESPINIFKELRRTFLPLLTAGWKLWPFAHIITYGVVPVEQRLLWVDMVEILWVSILAVYANEGSEARIAEEEHTAEEHAAEKLADSNEEATATQ